MAIQTGDTLPAAEFMTPGPDGPAKTSVADLFAGKTAVLFAVPGAFTPTCHIAHAPGFVAEADKLKAKGVDVIACVSVNDAFVLGAWSKALGADGKVTFLSDHDASFTKAIGMDMDASAFGLGTRSHRYAMVVKDGKVAFLQKEDNPGACEVSAVGPVLDHLG